MFFFEQGNNKNIIKLKCCLPQSFYLDRYNLYPPSSLEGFGSCFWGGSQELLDRINGVKLGHTWYPEHAPNRGVPRYPNENHQEQNSNNNNNNKYTYKYIHTNAKTKTTVSYLGASPALRSTALHLTANDCVTKIRNYTLGRWIPEGNRP